MGDFGGFNVEDGLSWQAVLAYGCIILTLLLVLSPHLGIYRMYLSMAMSITHRITGFLVFFFLFLFFRIVASWRDGRCRFRGHRRGRQPRGGPGPRPRQVRGRRDRCRPGYRGRTSRRGPA